MAEIRPVTPEDAEAVGSLLERTQMGASERFFRYEYWERYPFASEFPGVPIGWVLDEKGKIVGNLDNIRTLYRLGDRLVRATVAASWVVEPSARNQSLQLLTKFLKQKNVDLPMVVSASPTTAQVMTAMKVERIPIPDYTTPFFWALNNRVFASSVLKRKRIPTPGVLARPAGLGLWLRDIYYGLKAESAAAKARHLTEFDYRFDSLWPACSQAATLRAVRNRAVLEWRFHGEFRSNRASIVAVEEGSHLRGYAVLVSRGTSELGMDLWDIADLQAENDTPSVVRDLLLGSMKIARQKGADALKFMSGVQSKRVVAESLHPYWYRLPFWQLYYKAATPELRSALSAPGAWDFSPFDTY